MTGLQFVRVFDRVQSRSLAPRRTARIYGSLRSTPNQERELFERLPCERDVEAVASSMRAIASAFDASRLTGAEAARFVEQADEIERLAGAVKTLAAGRVAETNEWQAAGERSAADWLAKATSSSITDSRL